MFGAVVDVSFRLQCRALANMSRDSWVTETKAVLTGKDLKLAWHYSRSISATLRGQISVLSRERRQSLVSRSQNVRWHSPWFVPFLLPHFVAS